jgi:hypothetical protein
MRSPLQSILRAANALGELDGAGDGPEAESHLEIFLEAMEDYWGWRRDGVAQPAIPGLDLSGDDYYRLLRTKFGELTGGADSLPSL